MKEIKSLTGIRGIAALYVVLYHTVGSIIFPNGYLAVDLFFILSGFIMCVVYNDSFNDSITIKDYTNFMLHRFARIYPLYIFLVALAIIAFYAFGKHFTAKEILSNILLIQNLGLSKSIVGPSWSVSVEFILYLFFPFVFFLCSKFRAIKYFLWMLCFSLYFYITKSHSEFIIGSSDGKGGLDLWKHDGVGAVLRGFAGFCSGVFIYFLYRANFHNIIKKSLSQILITLSICIIIYFTSNLDILCTILFQALILSLALNENGLVSKILQSNIIMYMGRISFSIYLVHFLIGEFVWNYIKIPNTCISPRLVSILIIISLSFISAHILHKYVELPARKYIRKKTIT
ncbi:acyltransferase [Escherichia coli]|uniref:acyltransferase family protein n=3 Tax=Escherichia TaxID=561 RepID=UPI0018E11A70|nr:acyltransferase [Escherichia coli]MBI1557116.1 acyltransferase [Escherichia coli]MBI1570501.1 acyltransferase [Escherichia coli]MBI1579708.1 acyltransferase [Escherichia coli]MBI1594336.1 acyltransferase [Escherichia coli]MBI1606660.1 acyltransferase [Escherichia coli]